MATSRSAEVGTRLAAVARRAGLPLPARGDWQAADGWLAVGMALLCGGTVGAVLSVWTRIAPGTCPLPDRLLPLAVALTLADGAVAGGFALRYAAAEALGWRWGTIVAAVLGAIWSDPSGAHARFWIPWLLTAALLGLAMRAGETAAAALVDVLHNLPRGNPLQGHGPKIDWANARRAEAAPPDADLDRVTGENPLWTTWRLVAEAWLLAAASAAIGGPGPDYRAAAACAAFGGVVLVVGADIAVLRATWQAQRFTVDARHLRTHWGLALAVALCLVAAALVIPLPRGVVPAAGGWARLGFPSPTPAGTVVPDSGMRTPHVAQPAGTNAIGALAAIIHALVAEIFAFPFLLLAEIPLALPVLLVAAAVAVLVLRFPSETRAILRRLLASLVSALAFWRWIRLPARMRAALRRLGLLGPEGEPDPSGPPPPNLLERLWAMLDPRAAVRTTYRRFLRQMAEAGMPRPTHASPRAYAGALPDAPPEVADLTTAYELARYSDHAPERTWLEMARRGMAAVHRVARRLQVGPKRPRP